MIISFHNDRGTFKLNIAISRLRAVLFCLEIQWEDYTRAKASGETLETRAAARNARKEKRTFLDFRASPFSRSSHARDHFRLSPVSLESLSKKRDCS